MKKVKVNLLPVISHINLPTVLKTAVMPGSSSEALFVATQVGEILHIENGVIRTFLDIRPLVLKLGANGGYDERGLLGLAFHPEFHNNGLFYLHYTVAGTQGSGALPRPFKPDPCDPETLNLQWKNRGTQFDHIDTVEEWVLKPYGQPQKRRTLLYLRRPFLNHNGVNSLNFSPETGKLVLTTGDGGLGYDPFNLSQNDMEIAGKIIEIDTGKYTFINEPPIATRFDELPSRIQATLTVIAKGVRNISGVSFQWLDNRYVKYLGNVGQDLVESVFSFTHYTPVPVTRLVQAYLTGSEPDQDEFVNFGWRGWEGAFPTTIIRGCPANQALTEKTIAYYDDTVRTSAWRIEPLLSYFHQDSRPDKFGGSALTGVQPYMGNAIPDLTGTIVFIDLAPEAESQSAVRGVLAYTVGRTDCKPSDYSIIETGYDFGGQSAFYVSLGTNLDQTRLFLGVHGSTNVADYNQGSVFEIVP